jgi:hypothetical protein
MHPEVQETRWLCVGYGVAADELSGLVVMNILGWGQR